MGGAHIRNNWQGPFGIHVCGDPLDHGRMRKCLAILAQVPCPPYDSTGIGHIVLSSGNSQTPPSHPCSLSGDERGGD